MANFSQRLRHGKALCGKVFAGFVETFNALVDFKDNLKGDRDVNRLEGTVYVDRTDPNRPIVRLDRSRMDFDVNNTRGRFSVVDGDNGTKKYENRYYSVGGKTYEIEGDVPCTMENGIDALKIDISQSEPLAEIEHYDSFELLQAEQEDTDCYVIPLYTFGNGFITCDWRIGPDAAMGEF